MSAISRCEHKITPYYFQASKSSFVGCDLSCIGLTTCVENFAGFEMEKSEQQPHSRTMMPPWALSWRCYVIGILSYVLQLTSLLLSELGIISEQYFSSIYSAIIIQLSLLLFIKISVRPSQFDVAWRALLLGTVLNVALILSTFTLKYQTLGIYLIFLSFFHWSEFMMQSIFNPDTTDVSSYMLYHSDAYVVAFIASLVEYSLELYLLPSMKQPTFLTNIGLTLLIFGEGLRKVSMYTAKSNFNHYVQLNKNEGHELVTHGVYRLFRYSNATSSCFLPTFD